MAMKIHCALEGFHPSNQINEFLKQYFGHHDMPICVCLVFMVTIVERVLLQLSILEVHLITWAKLLKYRTDYYQCGVKIHINSTSNYVITIMMQRTVKKLKAIFKGGTLLAWVSVRAR